MTVAGDRAHRGGSMNASADPLPALLRAEQDRVIRATRMGIGMPMAGMLYWLAVAFLVSRYEIQNAVYLSFFATGAVFPLGILFTRLMGGDLFAKSPALGTLGVQLAAVQLFYWPVIIILASLAPRWTPYCMAVMFGSHFLPYGWLYRSKGYMVLTILTTVATTATVLIARGPVPHVVPLVAAASYFVSVLITYGEIQAVLKSAPAPAEAAA
jgi:hypothetical protein